VASDAGVPFAGLWLEAPEAVLMARIDRRRHDASDATTDVIRHQLEQPTGTMTWHRIDASTPPAVVLERASGHVRAIAGPNIPRIDTAAS
jgi:predicted kinase